VAQISRSHEKHVARALLDCIYPPCHKASLLGKTGRNNKEDKRGSKTAKNAKEIEKTFPLFFNLIPLYQ
jgi:hypothetical protein